MKNVYVRPRGEQWIVISEGCKRPSTVRHTFADAIKIGRRIAMNRGCELIVYRVDGTMRSKDSLGTDPFPPMPRDDEK
jgi:hypothetical protein